MSVIGSTCTALPHASRDSAAPSVACVGPGSRTPRAPSARWAHPPPRRVIDDNVSNDNQSITYLQSNCSYACVDTVCGYRLTYEHLLPSRFLVIVDPASVETLFSMTPCHAKFAEAADSAQAATRADPHLQGLTLVHF